MRSTVWLGKSPIWEPAPQPALSITSRVRVPVATPVVLVVLAGVDVVVAGGLVVVGEVVVGGAFV